MSITRNLSTGFGYELLLRYNNEGKLESASAYPTTKNTVKKHETFFSTESIEDAIKREEFEEQNGLNIFLHEDGKLIRKLASQGVYDMRNSGQGDIPLPADIKRILHNGECSTCANPMIKLVY